MTLADLVRQQQGVVRNAAQGYTPGGRVRVVGQGMGPMQSMQNGYNDGGGMGAFFRDIHARNQPAPTPVAAPWQPTPWTMPDIPRFFSSDWSGMQQAVASRRPGYGAGLAMAQGYGQQPTRNLMPVGGPGQFGGPTGGSGATLGSLLTRFPGLLSGGYGGPYGGW
jgi:hypothetical protein